MKRAPQWFTHSKVKDRIANYWPWALGLACGAAYWYAPEPFEQLRVSSLYAIRRPVLRGTQWLEVRDVDPETFALDLPPDQIFGPLPLKKQIKFVIQALKEDNELADGYVTRLVIDHMDLSLDPPFLGDSFVEYGGAEIMRFAIDDFLGKRPNAKHKFFDGDRFLRFISICANHNVLAKELLEKHDGVRLMFKAMNESSNEYARVLGMRAVTLFAFQQDTDGVVESQLISGGYLPKIIGYYRQSTGDPTDTRFVTMLLSSCLRMYPKECYEAMVESNIVKAAVNNINISRYKGLPQHIRILEDLFSAREKALNAVPPSPTKGGALTQEAQSRKSRNWFGFFSSAANDATRTEPSKAETEQAIAASSSSRQLQMAPAPTKRSRMVSQDGFESHRENPSDLPPLPPPKDIKAPVERLLNDADFIPVALGVMDVFPEYFEACRELVHLVDAARRWVTPFDVFEHRFFPVAIKMFHRHGEDADFEFHGMGEKLANICQWIFDDPECQPYLDPNNKAINADVKLSVKTIRERLAQREKKLAEGAEFRKRNEPVPVG